jgi:hypothetical protein
MSRRRKRVLVGLGVALTGWLLIGIGGNIATGGA